MPRPSVNTKETLVAVKATYDSPYSLIRHHQNLALPFEVISSVGVGKDDICWYTPQQGNHMVGTKGVGSDPASVSRSPKLDGSFERRSITQTSFPQKTTAEGSLPFDKPSACQSASYRRKAPFNDTGRQTDRQTASRWPLRRRQFSKSHLEKPPSINYARFCTLYVDLAAEESFQQALFPPNLFPAPTGPLIQATER
ncbi:hypothetical protein JMJ78_0000896 [Colletotrichum scovillei]|nr:hypothetical protein JMJ78_0000896 [Colletotrichum scovillei]